MDEIRTKENPIRKEIQSSMKSAVDPKDLELFQLDLMTLALLGRRRDCTDKEHSEKLQEWGW